jgi:hypothetical protein
MKVLTLIGLLVVCFVTATGCAGKTWSETLMDAGTQPGCIPPSIQIRLAQEGKPVPPCNRPAATTYSPQLYQPALMPPMSPQCTPQRTYIPGQGFQWVTVCR